MKKKHNWTIKSKHVLAAMVLGCVGLMIFAAAAKFPIEPVRNTAGYIIVPFQKGINKVGAVLDDATAGFQNKQALVKENKKLQKQVAELRVDGFKAEAKAILKGANLEDADIEALLPGMVAGIEKVEDAQARANVYVSAMNKVRDNAIKEHDKEVLDGTGTPGSAGGMGEEEKTEAEKFAETMVKEGASDAKGANDIIGAYK